MLGTNEGLYKATYTVGALLATMKKPTMPGQRGQKYGLSFNVNLKGIVASDNLEVWLCSRRS
jgi:hypothetical protein